MKFNNMASCGSCSIEIPDKQKYCSMCYGDPYYGTDGYYMDWLEQQEKERLANEQQHEETSS